MALVLTACGGGGASCSTIADDAIGLFQEGIDQLDGLSLSDLQNLDSDPFAGADFDARGAELEARQVEAGCTDEEMGDLVAGRMGDLEAGDSNPAGQFLISILTSAMEDGEFDIGF
jgi:hypothetical protein